MNRNPLTDGTAASPPRESAPTSIRQGLYFDPELAATGYWTGRAPQRLETSPVRGAGGARAARPSAPLNLESSSQVSRLPGYTVTILNFGDGVVEARAVFVDPRPRARAPKLEQDTRPPREATDEDLAWRLARARRTLLHRCLALKADQMLTFTKRGKFETRKDAYDAWRRFVKLCAKYYGAKFLYVAVPEQHADGRWHVHCAVRGFHEWGMLRRLWYKALGGTGLERGGDTPGGVNSSKWMGKRSSAYRISRYMTKYLGKGFTCGRGVRSFWCSDGLYPDEVVRVHEPLGDCIAIRLRELVKPYARKGAVSVWRWAYAGTHGFVVRST